MVAKELIIYRYSAFNRDKDAKFYEYENIYYLREITNIIQKYPIISISYIGEFNEYTQDIVNTINSVIKVFINKYYTELKIIYKLYECEDTLEKDINLELIYDISYIKDKTVHIFSREINNLQYYFDNDYNITAITKTI
jgi:hypothetical protein